MASFEHRVSFAPAFDKRDPDPNKNYGIHGVHITFSVIKEGEGLTFSVSTNWQLPHVQAEMDSRAVPASLDPFYMHKPMAFSVDIHRNSKQEYAGYRKYCEITGGECWCDGSSLLGEDFLKTLIEGGDEALFRRMELQFDKWKGA